MTIEGYEACEINGTIYLLKDVTDVDIETVRELYSITSYFKYVKEGDIWEIVIGRNGDVFFPFENKRYCILKKEVSSITNPNVRKGRRLSLFHYWGRIIPFPVKKINHLGKWKHYWENRLEQMERVWTEQLQIPPENDFERLFLESFPYYMGLTENAIQYLTDTEMDDNPTIMDSGTICHFRFSDYQLKRPFGWKNPFDWVLDHGSRDLAEWSRSCYFRNIKTYKPELEHFFLEYQRISPLSPFSWRLLYARLLFPLHYFETIEEYYLTSSEAKKYELYERLQKMLAQSDEYERFLSEFFQTVNVPVVAMKIPEVDWLKRVYL